MAVRLSLRVHHPVRGKLLVSVFHYGQNIVEVLFITRWQVHATYNALWPSPVLGGGGEKLQIQQNSFVVVVMSWKGAEASEGGGG